MLEIKNIYKTFNKGTVNEKKALNGVSFTLNDGDFVTVIGGNGAGKSTTLNAVAEYGRWIPVRLSSTASMSQACRSISARSIWGGSFRIR